jgi:hypothetical protein
MCLDREMLDLMYKQRSEGLNEIESKRLEFLERPDATTTPQKDNSEKDVSAN